ncbi:hypothetical protein ACWIGW_38875 [Nocardia brasiliensis]
MTSRTPRSVPPVQGPPSWPALPSTQELLDSAPRGCDSSAAPEPMANSPDASTGAARYASSKGSCHGVTGHRRVRRNQATRMAVQGERFLKLALGRRTLQAIE